ncbi:MAG: VWA domain-containing protein [Deltaproteobacteria bacterium]|nr:VWA domain-containing protein [Deltaproteobacteria bacterium]
MRFANPELLWLLALLPALIVGLALRYGWRRRTLASLGNLAQVARLAASVSPGRRLAKAILLVLGLGLVILTLARPQAGERTSLAPAVGIDLVVALDFSKSMLARDAYPSRIERAKAELVRLIDGLKGDRLGLVAFAGETLSYPLTTDYAAAKLFWRDMTPLDMPVGGTAIGKAIVAGTRLLTAVRGKGPPRSQVILLLTDGEDHESEPLEAAKEAGRLGIRVYTVGIGSRSGEPIPQLNEDGTISGYLQGPGGRPVTSRLEDRTLAEVAKHTRGRYIEMDPRHFAVEPILAELEKLTRSEIKSRLVKHYDEVYPWFLFPALLCLILELLLSDRRRRVTAPEVHA